MLTAMLTAAGVGLVSAYVPVLPAEPYVAAAAAAVPQYAIALGVSAAVGQTAGKVVLFYATRGAGGRLLPKWVVRQVGGAATARRRGCRGRRGPVGRWVAAVTNSVRKFITATRSPWQTALVVLLSAFSGIPPLLLTTVYAGRTQLSAGIFAALCLTGRIARLTVLTSALAWALGWRG